MQASCRHQVGISGHRDIIIIPYYTALLDICIYTTYYWSLYIMYMYIHMRGAPFTLMKHDGALALLDMCCVALPCLFV